MSRGCKSFSELISSPIATSWEIPTIPIIPGVWGTLKDRKSQKPRTKGSEGSGIAPAQGSQLTHHAVLPQHLDEVEGVEAQQQHQLVLTFPVVAGRLGNKNREFRTRQSPKPRGLWDGGEGRAGNEGKTIPKIPVLTQNPPRESGGEHPAEAAPEGRTILESGKTIPIPLFSTKAWESGGNGPHG